VTSLLRLAWPLTRTMPWATLATGCVAGTAFLAVLARVAEHAHAPLSQGAGRIAFVPVIAALAFVVRDPLRPLTGTTPVPARAVLAGHLLLTAAVLAITGWAQLRIIAGTFPPGAVSHPPAVYPLLAQLTGWCAITVAVAACADRSRYADLGGAVAVTVTAAAVALAWYAVAAGALILTCAAVRDHWYRYARTPDRLWPPRGNGSGRAAARGRLRERRGSARS
jgi:hypothetical protein